MNDAVTGETKTLELTLEREFTHPVAAVFKAWTDTQALRQWMGPGEVTAPESEMDAREGGVYVFPMITSEGVMVVRGTILEIVPNRKLRFTWAWDGEDGSPGHQMEVCIDFHEISTGTLLAFHQINFADAGARDHHSLGWNGSFDCLEQFLAA